jgi:hypothetical protein
MIERAFYGFVGSSGGTRDENQRVPISNLKKMENWKLEGKRLIGQNQDLTPKLSP